ncbi:hypothetical protein T484DRAFT_1792863 [Baffinella frigidus]|nr:hypothetical protein T484DRAFT_1792863 [Cryptophyta sp. CCMP2293]
MSSKTLSILKAAKDPKMCGASDADPNLCISAASGQVDRVCEYLGWALVDRVCEYLGWVLVSVVATILSIHAIETPGGDDDRQWLSFWLIFFAWSALERFTSVFFSNQPGYYPGDP